MLKPTYHPLTWDRHHLHFSPNRTLAVCDFTHSPHKRCPAPDHFMCSKNLNSGLFLFQTWQTSRLKCQLLVRACLIFCISLYLTLALPVICHPSVRCVQRAWAFSSFLRSTKKLSAATKETENWHFTVANIPLCGLGKPLCMHGFCAGKNNFVPSVWWISTANGWISAHYEYERASL